MGGGSNGKSRHLNCDCIAVAHDIAQGVAILLKNEDLNIERKVEKQPLIRAPVRTGLLPRS